MQMLRIRRADVGPGVLLSLHLLFSVASTVVGKTARDAIFLSHHTPLQMTAMDLLTMVAVALVVGMQLRLRAQISTKRMLVLWPLSFAIGDVALCLAMSTAPRGWTTCMVYLWIGVQASFGATQASLLGYHVLALRQAKRLCSVVGTGAILGWIGGGLLTKTLAAHFGASSLLLGAAALTALSSVAVATAWSKESDAVGDARAPTRDTPSAGLRQSALRVWASPHLHAIASLALVSSAVTTIAGLQFKVAASESFGATDQLAAFFGSFNLHAGLVALATQTLLTRWILGGLGLGSALAVAPAALAAGSVGVLFSGSLAAAIFLKGSDQVLRYSVDRAALECLYRPLSEPEIFEGKTFIDAFVCRLGDALGGVIALFFVYALDLGFSSLSVISLTLVAGWFASARAARQRYRARLLDNLRVHDRPADCQAGDMTQLRRPRLIRRAIEQRKILHADPAVRLRTLCALARAAATRSRVRCDPQLLRTALAAEIVGLTVLMETYSAADPLADDKRSAARDSIERIARLLFLVSPNEFPDGIRLALRSGAPAQTAGAVEYLDSTLTPPHRQILLSLLERWSFAI